MKALAEAAVAYLRKQGVQYGDVRFAESRSEKIRVKNAKLDAIDDNSSRGIGIRVLDRGAWGFAAVGDPNEEAVRACADRAQAIARASALTIDKPVALDERPAESGSWSSPRRIDPFTKPLAEKIDLLVLASETLRMAAEAKTAFASMKCIHEKKYYLDTEGADQYQDILQCGAGMNVVVGDGNDVQVRSYPTNFDDGDWAAAGFEWIEALQLVENAETLRRDALELLRAPECPSGEFDLIVGGMQLALQIHESCGHPTELDRALGTEISLAGGSFMTPERLGKLQYGSPIVNLYGDSTISGALGTFGWDDEGVAAQRFDIVREGLFVGYQTSRETAAQLGQRSNGTMRADGWANLPLIRMTNINLAPIAQGPSLEELIADTKRGIYLDINKSWSIDDLRLNFSFGCEYGRLIENGKLGAVVKNPVYTALTPVFWNACDAICRESEWRVWGVANCGKGQPMQIARVAHGCAPARFRNITVGRKS